MSEIPEILRREIHSLWKLLSGKEVRRFFQWKRSSWFIGFFFAAGGTAISVAVSLNSAESWPFIIAYVSFVLCLSWTLGSWLTSKTLKDRNPLNWARQRKRNQDIRKARTVYRLWKWTGTLACVAIFMFSMIAIHVLWGRKELSQMYGVLLPANDPDPPSPPHCKRPPEALAVYYGNSLAFFKRRTSIVIISVSSSTPFGREDKPMLWAERDASGAIVLNADIKGPDTKAILQVSRNHFWINDNNIFKSLSLRPDKSTIDLADMYGQKLSIRYLNRESLRVAGKFFIAPNAEVDIRENGATVAPGFIYSNGCSMDLMHSVFSLGF